MYLFRPPFYFNQYLLLQSTWQSWDAYNEYNSTHNGNYCYLQIIVYHKCPSINVFVGLCYPASPLGPAASFCVDLTTGKTSVLPGNTVDVMWTNKPTSDGGRCSLRGVLKITPPKWAQSVSYHMAFEKSTRYSFNIGDSLTNNAWGKNKQHILSVRYINALPFDNPELRVFNLHVLR